MACWGRQGPVLCCIRSILTSFFSAFSGRACCSHAGDAHPQMSSWVTPFPDHLKIASPASLPLPHTLRPSTQLCFFSWPCIFIYLFICCPHSNVNTMRTGICSVLSTAAPPNPRTVHIDRGHGGNICWLKT